MMPGVLSQPWYPSRQCTPLSHPFTPCTPSPALFCRTFVPDHCTNRGLFGECWNLHYTKGFTSIMGYGASRGCRERNYIWSRNQPCEKVAEFGGDDFKICVERVAQTWDQDGED